MNEQLPALLAGKVLHLRAKGSAALISDCRFETIGNRLFVVGTTPQGAPMAGRILAVAWEEVETFCPYNTVEDWRAVHEAWEAVKRNSPT